MRAGWRCRRPRRETRRPTSGLVGEVESIDPDVIHLLVSQGFIPVIMPIGVGADGTAYHINSDAFAGQLARTLERREAHPHDQRARHPRSRRQARVRADGERGRGPAARRRGPGGHAAARRAALSAVREGVRSVHIIDGGVGSALLLEVLTNSGIGTAMRSDAGPHFLADSRSYFAGNVDG